MDVWAYLGEERPPLVKLFDPLPKYRLQRGRAALVVIDMDYGSATEDEGIVAMARRRGIDVSYYVDRLHTIIPNIRAMQDSFRKLSLEVVHTKGRGTKGGHSLGDVRVRPLRGDGPDPRRRGILDELAPVGNEVVIEKDTPGPFGVTNIDHALRMLGVTQLVMTGIVTDQCVLATALGAFDHGYQVIMVEDACGTFSKALHDSTLRIMADWFSPVWTTAEVLENLRRLEEGAA